VCVCVCVCRVPLSVCLSVLDDNCIPATPPPPRLARSSLIAERLLPAMINSVGVNVNVSARCSLDEASISIDTVCSACRRAGGRAWLCLSPSSLPSNPPGTATSPSVIPRRRRRRGHAGWVDGISSAERVDVPGGTSSISGDLHHTTHDRPCILPLHRSSSSSSSSSYSEIICSYNQQSYCRRRPTVVALSAARRAPVDKFMCQLDHNPLDYLSTAPNRSHLTF